jgi:hypothetical protein
MCGAVISLYVGLDFNLYFWDTKEAYAYLGRAQALSS